MDFKAKSFLTLTHEAGGILGSEMYVRPEGISAYEKVTEDNSYYLVKADRDNWKACAKDISNFVPTGTPVMEYGPGGEEALRKVKNVIRVLNSNHYTGVDVSQTSINDALQAIKSIKADIETIGLLQNYWDQDFPISEHPTLAFFAGGSIENLDVPLLEAPPQKELTDTLSILARRTHGGWLLISFDSLQENVSTDAYVRAYSGPANAVFNLGVFYRMKEELKIDIDPTWFKYTPCFHKPSGAVMHMACATKDQQFLFNGKNIHIHCGESFHLQNSFRFSEDFFAHCSELAGLKIIKTWKHPHTSMQLCLLQDNSKEKGSSPRTPFSIEPLPELLNLIDL
jgi:uncharacterized SAM-dependent methyltransferase